MSKKIIITISILLTIILLGLVGYYFLGQSSGGEQNPIVQGFKNFFPFGGNDYVPPPSTSEDTNNNPPQQNQDAQNFTLKLREISSEPVSGAGTADFKAGTVVHYVEKATGHIYEVELFSPNKNRISNTTIPLVVDAVWGNKNNSFIARYLGNNNQTVDTYSLTLKANSTSTQNSIAGIPLSANISDVDAFGTNIFYLEQDDTFATGYISNFDGSKKKQIWTSPLKELNPQFVNDKTVALTTKPSPNIGGYLYLVDTGNGGVKNPLRDIPGLSTLVNGDVTRILYLTLEDNVLLSMYEIKDKSSRELDFITFPEKCVWSKKDKDIVYCAVPKEIITPNTLIDWYKGLISFSDDIKKYNIKDRSSVIIEELSKEAGGKIDVIKPMLTDNEQYLVFINKIDNSLWSLDLTK